MSQSKQFLVALSCVGILGAVLVYQPASAASIGNPGIDRPIMTENTLTKQSLTPPVRYMQGRSMGNGKHPSRPRGQKRSGMTSGGYRR